MPGAARALDAGELAAYGVTAREVKDALLARHPATAFPSGPGPWTCLEEWMNVDLLAFAAWTKPAPARTRFARVGYEVKVSRADYKRDLAKPGKRAPAVAFCHEFYFATPAGLLKDDEKAWEPPERFGLDYPPFYRRSCPGAYGARCHVGLIELGVVDRRTDAERRRALYGHWAKVDRSRAYYSTCPTCRGAGWIQDSPAVRAGAPRLWIPPDVGLIEVGEDGRTVVVRKAPLREARDGRLEVRDSDLGQLVRWVSVRPDPRHAELRRGGPSPL